VPGGVTARWATRDTAAAILAAVGESLADTTEGTPAYRALVAGAEVPWTDCDCGGQLTVHMPRVYPSDDFPVIKQLPPFRSPCGVRMSVAQYAVTVLRCAPTIREDGAGPTAAEATAAAEIDHEDRWAVRRGVCRWAEALPDERPKFVIMGDQIALTTAGGCLGSELTVFVGLPNCEDCLA
jgi:hypothetical protein